MGAYGRYLLPFLLVSWPALAQETPSAPASDAKAQEQGATKPPSPADATGQEPPKQQVVPELPPIKVGPAPPEAKTQKARPAREAAPATAAAPRGGAVAASPATNISPAANPEQAAQARNEAVMEKAATLNEAREKILPNIGVNSFDVDRQTLEALPQGDNAPLDKVLLQAPGISQDFSRTDYQISYFTRFSSVRYTPDLIGDLMFNGIATDVTRMSFLNGVQADAAFRVAPDHTLRAGVVVSAEQTYVTDNASVFLSGACGPDINPVQACGNTPSGVAAPIQVTDQENKLGWIAGVYIQDEWQITRELTLNTGLRFDQMWQYVDANQLSPRIAAVYKPLDGTVFHAGYARYFTPPPQAVGAPENYLLLSGTVAAAEVGNPGTVLKNVVILPSLPERCALFRCWRHPGACSRFGTWLVRLL